MPVKLRRAKGRRRRADQVPIAVRWWLHHGRSIGVDEAIALDLGHRGAWQISHLHFDRSICSGWTRAALRELGYGPQIDAHIAAGRCPPDGWRHRASAAAVALEGAADA